MHWPTDWCANLTSEGSVSGGIARKDVGAQITSNGWLIICTLIVFSTGRPTFDYLIVSTKYAKLSFIGLMPVFVRKLQSTAPGNFNTLKVWNYPNLPTRIVKNDVVCNWPLRIAQPSQQEMRIAFWEPFCDGFHSSPRNTEQFDVNWAKLAKCQLAKCQFGS